MAEKVYNYIYMYCITLHALLCCRFKYLSSGKFRYDEDGLNSLIYDRKKLDKRKLYTLISVEIDEPTVILVNICISILLILNIRRTVPNYY